MSFPVEPPRLLRAIFEHAREAIFVVDSEGRYVDANPSACTLTGLSRDELVGRRVGDLSFDLEDTVRRWRGLHEERHGTGDHLIRRTDGSARSVEYHAIVDAVPGRHLVLVDDVTDARRSDEALRASEARLRAIWDRAGSGLVLGTQHGMLADVNPAFCEMVGRTRDDLIGISFRDLTHPDDLPKEEPLLEQLLCGRRRRYTVEKRYLCPDGSVVWVTVTTSLIRPEGDGPPIPLAVVEDITERHATAEALKASQHRLRRLAAELARTEERERRDLAASLHDELGHDLALARIRLAQALARLEGGADGDLRELAAILDRSVASVRSLTFQLSSPLLHELGLAAALERLAEDVATRHDLVVRVHLDEPVDEVPEEVRSFLFRAARELLVNVVKHADATTAEVRLDHGNGRLSLTVRDDGRGFAPGALPPVEAGGFGLFYLSERTSLLGGALVADDADGARVTIDLPLAETAP